MDDKIFIQKLLLTHTTYDVLIKIFKVESTMGL